VTTPPSAFHLATGFSSAPTLAQLKRYVLDESKPLHLRQTAMIEVASRTSRRVTYLRTISDSNVQPVELRDAATAAIGGIKVLRTGRALVNRYLR
jgi:hypothetical protein